MNKNLLMSLVIVLVLAIVIGGLVSLAFTSNDRGNIQQLNWKPVTPPEPDMECWRAWEGHARAVVCKW